MTLRRGQIHSSKGFQIRFDKQSRTQSFNAHAGGPYIHRPFIWNADELASLRNADLADTHTSFDCNYASCLLCFWSSSDPPPLLRSREEESVTVQSPVCLMTAYAAPAPIGIFALGVTRDARARYSW
ncbi:hypothetical protein CEXT_716801 [Caerostris extrusa]|uniref:Uncharacterized protein n=1 Tax=Caerostris extrusa TaxID=172846 RepID=A0AAV4SX35_CAEEX|nr:hypothetical protein CEXT_716801 [Caerostris extrusa]